MNTPVAYDLSRLLLRSFGAGPNGIDRVDLNLARYFLGSEREANCGLLLNRLRPTVIGNHGAAAFLDVIDMAWKENIELADDQAYQAVRRRLLCAPDQKPPAGDSSARVVGARAQRGTTAWRMASALLPQLAMFKRVPKDAIFIHATQYPDAPLFRWLDRRPDVKPVFSFTTCCRSSVPIFSRRKMPKSSGSSWKYFCAMAGPPSSILKP